jgi:hypothetical protein
VKPKPVNVKPKAVKPEHIKPEPPARVPVRKRLKAFAFRIGVRMLASAFVTFTIAFVSVSCVLLLIELIPWIVREGVTDIDPLPILIVSFIAAFAATYARFLIMKKFSGIRP